VECCWGAEPEADQAITIDGICTIPTKATSTAKAEHSPRILIRSDPIDSIYSLPERGGTQMDKI